MDFEFADRKLQRLYVDRRFNAKMAPEVVTAFRDVMDTIRDAPDEREFYALKSLHFEKMKRSKAEHSMRLNNQFRLVVQLVEQPTRQKLVRIIGIEDYH